MASIRKRNGKYQAQFKHRGYYRAKTFDRIADARDWIQEEYQRVAVEFNFTKKVRPRNTAEILIRYLSEITPTKRGFVSETAVLNKLLLERWVKIPLDNLCISHIASYRDRRLQEVSPATFKRQFNVVKSACKLAEDEWNLETPLTLLKRLRYPQPKPKLVTRITAQKEAALIHAAKNTTTPQLANIIRIALATGMRRGEILGIRPEHIDKDHRLLQIPDTKNGYPRVFPLNDTLLEILQEFAIADSKPSANGLRQAWERIRIKARCPNVRFHDLRHEAISRWWEQGLTLPQIASRSGHRSFSELFRYSHCSDLLARQLTE